MATIIGTSSSEALRGGFGDDTINALGGNETINGQAGNDSLDGGADANHDGFRDHRVAEVVRAGGALPQADESARAVCPNNFDSREPRAIHVRVERPRRSPSP